jgi:hypothetical protein
MTATEIKPIRIKRDYDAALKEIETPMGREGGYSGRRSAGCARDPH